MKERITIDTADVMEAIIAYHGQRLKDMGWYPTSPYPGHIDKGAHMLYVGKDGSYWMQRD